MQFPYLLDDACCDPYAYDPVQCPETTGPKRC